MDVRIHDILTRNARLEPARLAVTLGDDRRTFGELDVRANQAAHRLEAAGVRHRDRVVWWGPTDLAALDVCYGVTRLGAALAPVNPEFGESEATTALTELRPRLVVVHPTCADLARAVTGPLGLPVVVTGDDWLAGSASTPLPRRGDAEDPCTIFLTSGSTGVSKAAILSHRANWLRAVAREHESGSPGIGGEVVMFGLYHMAGWWMTEHTRGRSTDPRTSCTAPTPTSCSPPSSGGAQRRCTASPRCGSAFSTRATAVQAYGERQVARCARCSRARRGSISTSSPRCAHGSRARGCRSPTARPRSDSGAVLADGDIEAKPGSVGLPPPAVDARIDDTDELLLPRPHDVLRLPRPARRRPRRRSTQTAGSTPATSRPPMPTATSRSPVVARRASGPAVSGSRRSRWRPRSRRTPRWPRSVWWGSRTARWGEVVCAAIVPRPGATRPVGR